LTILKINYVGEKLQINYEKIEKKRKEKMPPLDFNSFLSLSDLVHSSCNERMLKRTRG
jgi:hypothetical protein